MMDSGGSYVDPLVFHTALLFGACRNARKIAQVSKEQLIRKIVRDTMLVDGAHFSSTVFC